MSEKLSLVDKNSKGEFSLSCFLFFGTELNGWVNFDLLLPLIKSDSADSLEPKH